MFTLKIYYSNGDCSIVETVRLRIAVDRMRVDYREENDGYDSCVILGSMTSPDVFRNYEVVYPSSIYVENARGKTIESLHLDGDLSIKCHQEAVRLTEKAQIEQWGATLDQLRARDLAVLDGDHVVGVKTPS